MTYLFSTKLYHWLAAGYGFRVLHGGTTKVVQEYCRATFSRGEPLHRLLLVRFDNLGERKAAVGTVQFCQHTFYPNLKTWTVRLWKEGGSPQESLICSRFAYEMFFVEVSVY